MSSKIKNHFNIPMVPVYYPTDQEFQNPFLYIKSLRDVGQAHGIIKIVPPKGFNPSLDINEIQDGNFNFRTRNQVLGSLDGHTRRELTLSQKLYKFHQSELGRVYEVPELNGKLVNMQKLATLGMVNETDSYWQDVTFNLGFSAQYSSRVRQIWEDWIYPFQMYIEAGKSSSQSEICFTNDKISPFGASSDKDRYSRTRDKQNKVTEISQKENPQDLDPKEFFTCGSEICIKCLQNSSVGSMIICDECQKPFHFKCLQVTELKSVPKWHWNCYDCIVKTGVNFGFKENDKLRNIITFRDWSTQFKLEYMKKFKAGADNPAVIEAEFWKLVESPFEDFEVEYGADLHTTVHGSGFPTLKKYPNNIYSKSPWNLNNISVAEGSLLKSITVDISGMTIPWLYVGMLFSAFCWHYEDHFTYSINYLHHGDVKTWCKVLLFKSLLDGIPASSADDFEKAMRSEFAELFEDDPDLLFHLTTLISPGILKKRGVSVFMAHQSKGEFIITFPKAFHAGFNNGFNIAEAVNFAPADWLKFGDASIELYSKSGKPPVFCHEELVIRSILDSSYTEYFLDLFHSLQTMVLREIDGRSACLAEYPFISQRILAHKDDDGYQCIVCKKFCLLSVLTCSHGCSGKYCLKNCFKKKICACNSSAELLIYMPVTQVSELFEKLELMLTTSSEWRHVLGKACSLDGLKNLLHKAESIPFFKNTTDVQSLRQKVLAAEDIPSRISNLLLSPKKNFIVLEELINEIKKLGMHFDGVEKLQYFYDNGISLRKQAIGALSDLCNYPKNDLLKILRMVAYFPFKLLPFPNIVQTPPTGIDFFLEDLFAPSKVFDFKFVLGVYNQNLNNPSVHIVEGEICKLYKWLFDFQNIPVIVGAQQPRKVTEASAVSLLERCKFIKIRIKEMDTLADSIKRCSIWKSRMANAICPKKLLLDCIPELKSVLSSSVSRSLKQTKMKRIRDIASEAFSLRVYPAEAVEIENLLNTNLQ